MAKPEPVPPADKAYVMTAHHGPTPCIVSKPSTLTETKQSVLNVSDSHMGTSNIDYDMYHIVIDILVKENAIKYDTFIYRRAYCR